MKYVVDTNIFNHLHDGLLSPSALPSDGTFVATKVQLHELEKTPEYSRRLALIETFCGLAPELVLTESFAFDIPGSGFDESKWGDGERVAVLKNRLDAMERRPNNWHDAIIAEVALVNGYVLLTSDRNLARASNQHGVGVQYWDQNSAQQQWTTGQ